MVELCLSLPEALGLMHSVAKEGKGHQRVTPLTRDSPDGFLRLLWALGDVVDNHVALQQVREEVCSREVL